jgi:hypothetical protein
MSGLASTVDLSEAALLAAWEEGAGLPRPERALALLRREGAAAGEDPAHWPLGRSDALLLDLHARVFGGNLAGTAECPACDEEVELSLAVEALRTSHAESLGEHELEDQRTQLRIRFRLLCADDLTAAARQPDAESAGRALLERCVLAAERDDDPVPAGELPASVVEELGRRMAAADPQAELRLQLQCPACETEWTVEVDPAAFVWHELEERARAALLGVACLAAAYGWSEGDVLAMSRERRRAYLELAGS